MRGHVYQRGETYTYVIDLPPDPATGKRRQKSKGGFVKEKHAQLACAEMITKLSKGELTEETDMTVAEYFDTWLQTYAKPNYKPTSYETAVNMTEAQIKKHLGKIYLKKLTPIKIEKFYETLREKYSSEYVKNIHALLRRALRRAYIWDLLEKNIMDKVSTPKVQKKEMEFWSFEEWNKFLAAAKGHVHYIFFSLALRNGMRRGEALGLRWSDIDFEKKQLTIRQTVNWTKAGVIFQTPKTSNSQRTVEMDSFLIEDLQERQKQIQAIKERLGDAYKDHDLVCCYEDGTPIKPKRITEAMDVLIRKAGVKRIRIHDMRHTHASFLLWLEINPKVAAERLGMSPQMFNERYAHLLPTMQRDAVSKIEEMMKNRT